MECEKCTDDLTAYLDGELSEQRALQIKSHVAACRSCASELAALEDSAGFFGANLREVEPASEVWQDIRTRISVMEAPTPALGLLGFLELHRWAVAGAALIITAVVGISVWGYWRREQSDRQLREYMNAYIQQRESQNPGRMSVPNDSSPQVKRDATAKPNPYRGDDDFNPFMQVDYTPYSNPFRAEAQR